MPIEVGTQELQANDECRDMLALVNVRSRSWIMGAMIAAIIGIVVWLVLRRDRDEAKAPPASSRRLDIDAFRSALASRLEHARHLAAPAQKPASHRTERWPMQGRGASPNLGKSLIEPQCTLGPRELCTTLQPLISECDGGDARSCLAVGQFLADTPPRAYFAIAFFNQACGIGDAAGCERVDELKSDAPLPCASDPLACQYRALRANDRDLFEEACSLGAANSCAFAAEATKDDPETSRTYQELGCQLGEPVMCMELGHRLQPGCVPGEYQLCYPPDPVQANQALQIACAAGWEQDAVCDQLPKL